MSSVRCSVCRRRFINIKNLITHIYTKHSKFNIIRHLIRRDFFSTVPNKVIKKNYGLSKKYCTKSTRSHSNETETLYMSDDFHILCGQNQVIIGDSKSNVDVEFSFNQSYDIQHKCDKNALNNRLKKQVSMRSPSSASSEGSSINVQVNKRKVKRKKSSLSSIRKLNHYSINITKLRNRQSLNEQTGEFYICYCREQNNSNSRLLRKNNLRIITSDTESCSDTGKSSLTPVVEKKVFCKKCGSGYRTQMELTEHMYIHETFCRLCNISFPTEYSFKEHMRLHIFKVFVCYICNAEFSFKDILLHHLHLHFEDRTFESILDMEEEYKIPRYPYMNINYNNSINNILYYLNDNPDIYYSPYGRMKIYCDICYTEIYFYEYERHLQNVHYLYKC